MEIFFKNAKLAKVLNERSRLQKEYGAQNAKLITLRLAVLAASATLADVSNKPPERCHMLTGNYAGCFAVDIQHPYRIVFAPEHDPLPIREDGGLDLKQITKITILEIVDYH